MMILFLFSYYTNIHDSQGMSSGILKNSIALREAITIFVPWCIVWCDEFGIANARLDTHVIPELTSIFEVIEHLVPEGIVVIAILDFIHYTISAGTRA